MLNVIIRIECSRKYICILLKDRNTVKRNFTFFLDSLEFLGGADPSDTDIQRKGNAVSTVWSFDPTSRTWYKEPSMCTTRRNFGLVVSHGKLFAFGGQDENGTYVQKTKSPS